MGLRFPRRSTGAGIQPFGTLSKMFRSAVFGIALPASVIVGPGVLAQAPAPSKAPSIEIDLKLFDRNEKDADRSKGCTVSVWQANRDPDKDQYALLFVEQLRGRDHARDPARIKIGAANVPLARIATGGKTNGYGLYEFQLYKTADGNGYVVLDLKLGDLMGEAVEIESGKMMVTMLGKEAFRASVKGGAGCMGNPLPRTPAAAALAAPVAPALSAAKSAAGSVAPASAASGPAPTLRLPPAPKMFERYKVDAAYFSPGFRQEVQKKFKCDAAVMRTGVTGYSLSEDSAIWEIPCERFAYQATSVFALVYVPAPEKEHTFITIPAPPGRKRTIDNSVLMSPVWDIKSRVVTSVSLGRGQGDCGVLEKFRVTEEGGLALMEYREKPTCDGVQMTPEQFPLVFPKR
ncbi:MAG: hypothetical protein FD175_104 [Beijerinckiaceae bacterium]|nr:MAG: hypothetical protein FD175_104 [Beijerinckiaceae bacterium]